MANSNVIQIESTDDPRLASYCKLYNRDVDDQWKRFIAEGQLVVDRLIASDCQTESLLVESSKVEKYRALVPSDLPIYSLSRSRIQDVVGFDFHRGVMACGVRSVIRNVNELQFSDGRSQLAVAVLGVSDQENLGSILRSAAALGIDQILLGPRTIDPFLRRVIRVSMASVFKHQFYRMNDPINQLPELTDRQDFRTIASTLSSSVDLRDFVHDARPMILMVGHESAGIDSSVAALATDRVKIPMELGTDSLNVAVAAAIFMYELTRWPHER